MTAPVVDGSSGQHHGVVVGPLGGVAPALLVAVPEVAAGRVAHNPLGETLPHGEGKVHLDRRRRVFNNAGGTKNKQINNKYFMRFDS